MGSPGVSELETALTQSSTAHESFGASPIFERAPDTLQKEEELVSLHQNRLM
jgi:hypothetical protein